MCQEFEPKQAYKYISKCKLPINVSVFYQNAKSQASGFYNEDICDENSRKDLLEELRQGELSLSVDLPKDKREHNVIWLVKVYRESISEKVKSLAI